MLKNRYKNLRRFLSYRLFAASLVIVALFAATPFLPKEVFAASNSNFTQTINAGTLATDIRDNNRVAVANPSVGMSTISYPFACLTGGSRPSGTFGTNTERIYVDNPGNANNGWTLALAATGGATSLWQNGGSTQNYDFNDPGGSGCTDGVDADTRAGQMTVDPSVGTITADCASCVTTNITRGASTAYNQGTVDSITLLNAAAASDDFGRWYLTGADVDQTIPAEQAADSYTINLTLTVTAL
ncbi:MAG: hypothetical protein M3Q14_04645 [bacterium]|nr:hypothetical protein [bacterium]